MLYSIKKYLPKLPPVGGTGQNWHSCLWVAHLKNKIYHIEKFISIFLMNRNQTFFNGGPRHIGDHTKTGVKMLSPFQDTIVGMYSLNLGLTSVF